MTMPANLSNIQAVFFDFGATLIYTKDPWPPFYAQADMAMASVLQRAGLPVDPKTFSDDFDSFLDLYYADRGTSLYEKTTYSTLKDILAINGYRNLPDGTLRSALNALYSVTQKNWYLEDDAVQTLESLQNDGYRLGLISNTSDDQNVFQMLDRWNLRPYFDVVITSAGCNIRKPDERIFRQALEALHVQPAQAAMVGDNQEADILGANRLGMTAIWLTRRAQGSDPAPGKPDMVIRTLSELPALFCSQK